MTECLHSEFAAGRAGQCCWEAVDGKAGDLLARSSIYREFLAEREEILRHKWVESEKAGRDIGFEAALVNWVVHHRARWRRQWRQGLAMEARN